MRHVPFILVILSLLGAIQIITLHGTMFSKEWQSYGTVLRDHPVRQPITATSSEIIFVGDLMLARAVEWHMDDYGSEYPYRFVTQWFRDADAVVGNFEGTIPVKHVPTPSMGFQFSVDSRHVPALAHAHVTHVSLANNHTYDFGNFGYQNTVLQLTSQGIATFGDPRSVNSSSTVYYQSPTGEVVALIGAEDVSSRVSIDELVTVIKAAAQQSDIQIAYPHWGVEYTLTRSSRQREVAERLIDAGADLVIGHHPHVVQDVEVYQGKLIVYSLGNFIFDQYFSDDVQTGLAVGLLLGANPALVLHPVSTLGSKVSPYRVEGAEKIMQLQALADRSDPEISSAIISGKITLQEDLAVSPQMD